MKILKTINVVTALLAVTLSNLSASNTLLFADEHDPHNRLIYADYGNMNLLNTYSVEGSLNHHADLIGNFSNARYIMMVPKGSNFVTFRKISDRSFVKKLRLPFQPRSGDAYNSKYNLTLLNSSTRPSAVLIDNNSLRIVGRAGFNIRCNKYQANLLYSNSNIPSQNCTAPDFGGSAISGHPIWLDSESFAILDRSNRMIHVYGIRKSGEDWQTYLKDTVRTNTSLHQMLQYAPNSRTFYGITEGNQGQSKLARLYKFYFDGRKLRKTASKAMIVNVRGKKYKAVGGHNLYITPNKGHLYCATAAGVIFVVKSSDLNIVTAFPAGAGAGHVSFMQGGKYGVITNHQDNFVTVFNYRQHRFIKNIRVSFNKERIASLLHSHSPYIQGNYFYNFWTDGGVFYRINLRTLSLDGSFYVGGVPIQGNYFR